MVTPTGSDSLSPLPEPHPLDPAAALGRLSFPLVARSRPMRQVVETLLLVAPTSATVLLVGETGTGKGDLAKALHEFSEREDRPFVGVNLSSLPETLVESEIFGHEKGAFSGAHATRPGRVELAEDGTLFVDEVGDLSLQVQIKLLRLLEEREYERLGGVTTLRSAARFVAATHRDLRALVKQRKFREDLYHRLNVVTIEVPPLRERREDIPPLVEHFVAAFSRLHGREVPSLGAETLDLLYNAPWPGNVRDLRNAVERMVLMPGRGGIDPRSLRVEASGSLRGEAGAASACGVPINRDPERLRQALGETRWNVTAAATRVGINRQYFHKLLKRHGIVRPVSPVA